MAEQLTEKRPLTFGLFVMRLLSGLTGGVAGTLATFVIYFIMLSLVPSGDQATSLSVFVIILMAFVGTLTANTITALMVTFMDNAKYSRRKTILTHIFMFNLILFLFTIPIYLIGISLDVTIGVVAFHFLLSAFISSVIMETLAGGEYSLLGIYSSALGIFIAITFAFIVLAVGGSKGTIQLAITFGAMPAVWLILQVTGGFTELIYDNFLRYYGIDALSTATDLGGDTEVEPKDEDEEGEEQEK
ncbi:hypothetical protein JXA05_04165 [Candidatus Peregrinibacteria bacterium]|nr:hypothetical protein [Candidatus Peregrinibacteria bacterium]